MRRRTVSFMLAVAMLFSMIPAFGVTVSALPGVMYLDADSAEIICGTAEALTVEESATNTDLGADDTDS